ncbi:hypothetical protein GCM10009430_31840 [Aquimarina litoralis]|uniref:Uncharacterized protein n=1 Tax=Aquimarina litoralis TaxID=584605 RepID=A0ABP3U781_9FLAO
MEKYNAVVTYSTIRNGHRRGRLIKVVYNDENISNEEIIELADKKIIEDSNHVGFTIESSGSIHSRDKVN